MGLQTLEELLENKNQTHNRISVPFFFTLLLQPFQLYRAQRGPNLVFVQVILDLIHRAGNDPLIGSHLVFSRVHQVSQVLQSSLVLLLQSHVLVQPGAPGAHRHHQLLIGILKTDTKKIVFSFWFA